MKRIALILLQHLALLVGGAVLIGMAVHALLPRPISLVVSGTVGFIWGFAVVMWAIIRLEDEPI